MFRKLAVWPQRILALSLTFSLWTTLGGCGQAPEISTLPELGLSQKQVYKFDVDDFISDPDHSDPELLVEVVGSDATRVLATVDSGTHVLTLTAAANFAGTATLELIVTDPDGNEASAPLSVQVHANRSCQTVVSYDSKKYGTVSSLALAGQFNSWSTTSHPMTDPDGDGIYTAPALSLATGYYPYKLVKNGTTWDYDPGNPYRAWLDGFENSELRVSDCQKPLLSLEALSVDGATGSLSADVSVQDGEAGSGLDPTSLTVTAGGETVDAGFDAFTRTFEVRLSGLAAGKHSLRFSAKSSNGQAADVLYVPVWVESTPFNWKDASLYFAFTDRFSNGGTGNDSPITNVATTANYQGGDYAGLQKKIEEGYFTSLGINTLWISPNFDNTNNAEYGDDGRLYSGYHGYWPISATSSDAHMGSNAELKSLIAAAHTKGIRVMFDLVANHVHTQHPYYTQYKNAGWFNSYALCNQNDGWNTNPIGCWFAPYLPDINYRNADALHTFVGDAVRLIEEYDIDGYRVDAVKHLELAYLRNLIGDIEARVERAQVDPSFQFYTVGETFVGEWNTPCSTGCSQALIDQYIGPGLLDGQFDFPLYWQVLKTFARGESTMNVLVSLLDQSEAYYGRDALMSTFLGNHDVPRFVSHANGNIADQWGNGAKEQGWTNPPAAPTSEVPYQKLRAAFSFLATVKGVPLVYYGDELGLPGAGDPDNRRMMKFTPSLSTFETNTLSFVQKLFKVRQSSAALRQGERVTLLGADPAVYVFARQLAGETVLVAINASGSTRTVSTEVTRLGYPTGTVLTDALAGGTVTVSGANLSLTVPAYGTLIYR